MPVERQTARKVRIADIMAGSFVHKEGMEPSFVETASGAVVRARIIATVMNAFRSDDGNFGSLTLDDGTDTIRAKVFKDLRVMEGVTPGDLVEAVGKVREYNGEMYVMPELIRRVRDPNMELLRRAELLRLTGAPSTAAKPAKNVQEQAELRKRVLEAVEASKDGATFAHVAAAVKADEEALEDVINELLSEGVCYEPTPGKIRKI